jgi:hypothetical protein
MKVGDLVSLYEGRYSNPSRTGEDYCDVGIILKIERDRFAIGDGPILRDEGCHIRWSTGRTTVEPIQYIQKIT